MILYILKFSACLAVFMLFYKLFLEKESFHKFKRGYLLGTLILSVIIPLITFTTYIDAASIEVPVDITEIETPPYLPEHMLEEPTNYLSIVLWSIYALGVFIFLTRFGRNLFKIINRIKQNPKFKNHSVIYVLLHELVPPHTFLNYIFFNKTKFEAREIPQEVLIHEETHAKEKHALDILFVELMQIVFWFNPLLYFIKKDIKLNHEFLADQAVISKGFEVKNYQNTLLAFSSNAQEPQLVNAINYSSIKKRFTVMKTHTSKHIFWVRSLVLLPLLAILIYSFSSKKEIVKNNFLNIEKANHTARSIEIEVLDSETYKVDGIKATKATFVSVINQLHQDITPEIRNRIINVHVNNGKPVSDEDVWFIYNSFMKYGFHRIVTYNQEIVREKGNTPFAIENNDEVQTNTLPKIKGLVCEVCEISLTKEELANLIIETNTNEAIASFKIKFIGKPTVSIKSNRLNEEALAYLNESPANAVIQLFNLRTPTTSIKPPVLIHLITEPEKGNFPPPPPPPPYDATPEEKENYKKLVEDYNKWYSGQTKEGKLNTIPPPKPPKPESPTQGQEKQYYKVRTNSDKQIIIENGKAREITAPKPPAPPKPKTVAQPPKVQQQYYDSLATIKYEGKLTKNKSRDNQKIVEEYAKEHPESVSKNDENLEVVEIPADLLDKETPKTAYDFVKSLKNDDITYYYNGKETSYNDILKITKKETRISVTTNIENHIGTVYFTSVK